VTETNIENGTHFVFLLWDLVRNPA